jgi:prolyl-tRNA editing enzyme YbaK/EbsC (Cys-tRNA(Pro) deacylase)
MHKLVILIDKPENENYFERLWPLFLRWAEQMPGLRREVTTRVAVPILGANELQLIHELYFESAEAAKAALNSEAGRKAGENLQKITKGKMSLFLADHMEDTVKNAQEDPQPADPRTPQDLMAFMEKNNCPGDLLELDVPTPTVLDAAKAVNADPDQIVKSVLFLVGVYPVLAVAYGSRRIDFKAIASVMSAGRKRVKMADKKTVLAITGFPVGAVPPFGHARKLHTLMDSGLMDQEIVYAGGGSDSTLIRVAPDDIRRVTRARLMRLLEPEPTPDASLESEATGLDDSSETEIESGD